MNGSLGAYSLVDIPYFSTSEDAGSAPEFPRLWMEACGTSKISKSRVGRRVGFSDLEI